MFANGVADEFVQEWRHVGNVGVCSKRVLCLVALLGRLYFAGNGFGYLAESDQIVSECVQRSSKIALNAHHADGCCVQVQPN